MSVYCYNVVYVSIINSTIIRCIRIIHLLYLLRMAYLVNCASIVLFVLRMAIQYFSKQII